MPCGLPRRRGAPGQWATGLANGYLPAGTIISLIDTGDDASGNNAESTNLTAGLTGGGTEPWLTEIDYSLGQGGRDQPAPVWRGANTYDVGIETPKLATSGSEYSVVQTTRDLESLVIQFSQGPGGGSHGLELHAPTSVAPEPGVPVLALLAAAGFFRRRRPGSRHGRSTRST